MRLLLRATLRAYTLVEFVGLAVALLSGGVVALPLIRGPLWMDLVASVLGFSVSLYAALKTANGLDRLHRHLEQANALRSGLH